MLWIIISIQSTANGRVYNSHFNSHLARGKIYLLVDALFFLTRLECTAYSSASNYTCHLSKQGSSSKLKSIISFSNISKTLILMCTNNGTIVSTHTQQGQPSLPQLPIFQNSKNNAVLQLTQQTLLDCILCRQYTHIRNYFYCQLAFLLSFYLIRKD